METNLKYNLNLGDYAIRKIRELYPIDDVVVITTTGIPISDDYASYMEEHIDELCNHFHKDLIVRVSIPHVPRNSNIGYKFESEFDTINLDDEDDGELLDNPYEYSDEDEDDEDEYEYFDCPDIGYIESFDEGGIYYNFANVAPDVTVNGDFIYDFTESMEDVMQPSYYNQDESAELNAHIDSEGENWMFTFTFRHPISFSNDLMKNPILSDATIQNSDKVIFSLMNMVSNGIVNIINSETMKLIIKTMIGLVINHGRIPFVGTVRFQLLADRLEEHMRENYTEWKTILYNMILQDFVDYESRVTPPITFKADEFYFKPTDFLGQYYFPKGLKKKEEEGKTNGRKESYKERNNKDNKKDNDKNQKGNNIKSKNSRSSRRSQKGSSRKAAGETSRGTDTSNGISGV